LRAVPDGGRWLRVGQDGHDLRRLVDRLLRQGERRQIQHRGGPVSPSRSSSRTCQHLLPRYEPAGHPYWVPTPPGSLRVHQVGDDQPTALFGVRRLDRQPAAPEDGPTESALQGPQLPGVPGAFQQPERPYDTQDADQLAVRDQPEQRGAISAARQGHTATGADRVTTDDPAVAG